MENYVQKEGEGERGTYGILRGIVSWFFDVVGTYF